MGIFSNIGVYWKTIVSILAPILLLLIPLCVEFHSDDPKVDNGRMVRCLYVACVMAVFWCTEVVPLTATALIPLFAFPYLQVMTAKDTANAYVQDISFLFMGGLMLAVAIEETNLHRRLALTILLKAGSEPSRLLLGVMITTAFLSMWISNTATTAMMVPVVLALLSELIRTEREAEVIAVSVPSSPTHNSVEMKMKRIDGHDNRVAPISHAEARVVNHQRSSEPVVISRKTLSKSEQNLCKCLLLGVAYSASLGGTATLTGTPPNIVMTGLLTKAYGDEHPINFATWICYNGPGMIINMTFAFFWLQLLFIGPKKIFNCFKCSKKSTPANDALRNVLQTELEDLGSPSFGEICVTILFVCLLLMWFTHSPWWKQYLTVTLTKEENVTKTYLADGLNVTNITTEIVKEKLAYSSDANCVILIVFLLFFLPKRLPDFGAFCEGGRQPQRRDPILTWKAVEKSVPWGIVLLLGGGFALGTAVKKTGLSALIGKQLSRLDLSSTGMCVVSLILMTYTTEFTSNTATSTIILPITMSVAEKRCINPLYLTMPVSEAASFAYMLPVATPPSAIVFSAGILKVTDMIMAGFVMNIVCMCEVLLSIHTWGWAMFDIGTYPQWAGNSTGCL